MREKNFKELDNRIASAFNVIAKKLPIKDALQLDTLRELIITNAKSIGRQCYIDGSNDCHQAHKEMQKRNQTKTMP